jgi:hypothetical protein
MLSPVCSNVKRNTATAPVTTVLVSAGVVVVVAVVVVVPVVPVEVLVPVVPVVPVVVVL